EGISRGEGPEIEDPELGPDDGEDQADEDDFEGHEGPREPRDEDDASMKRGEAPTTEDVLDRARRASHEAPSAGRYMRVRGTAVTRRKGRVSRGRELEGDRVARVPPPVLLHIGTVERHPVRDDPTERVSDALVVQATGRKEIVVPVQATLQLARVRHANSVAVHAELRVVHRIDDLDLGPVEEVDPPVVHLPYEDLVGPRLQPFLQRVDVDHPVLLAHELGHELNELELESVAVRDEVDHLGDVLHRLLEHDHVQLHRFEPDAQGLLDPAEDRGEWPLSNLLKRRGVEGIDRHVDALQ